MIYLKTFNEGQFYTIENILYEFTKDNLAYLLDDDNMKMTLTLDKRLSESGRFNYYEFSLTNAYGFKWDDIKDHFIPFIQRLQKLDYANICPLGSSAAEGKEVKVEPRHQLESEYYSLEDTLNDNFYLKVISKITFYIKQTN